MQIKTWAAKIPYIISGKRLVFKFKVQAKDREQAHLFAKAIVSKKIPVEPNLKDLKLKRL